MKLKPCPKCKNKDIDLYDCGYSSFNYGGGKCNNCGYKKSEMVVSCFPEEKELAKIWNKPIPMDKLKEERKKTRALRKQLRNHGLNPLV